MEVPAFFLNNLKPESRKLWARFNGQLVNIDNSIYMSNLPKERKCVSGLNGTQDEGIELYVPLEYLNYRLSVEEMEIAELLYHSFWQREKYSENKEAIIAAVFDMIGDFSRPKTTHADGLTVLSAKFTHDPYPENKSETKTTFESYWTLTEDGMRVKVMEIPSIQLQTYCQAKITPVLDTYIPLKDCPFNVKDAFCGG